MKYLFTLLLAFCCMTVTAQRYGNDTRELQHMFLIEGGYSWSKFGSPAVSSTDVEASAGYRYCFSENTRIGLNVSYGFQSEVLIAGVHVDLPFTVSDNVYIGPSVSLSYGRMGTYATTGMVIPALAITMLFKMSDAVAFNIEPGIRLYVQKGTGYEVPIRAGFRFMF